MRPVIGVSPQWDEERNRVFTLAAYPDWLERAGALPIMLPLTQDIDELMQLCDGILLTGGPDVEPSYYGADRSQACGPACEARDRMELALLQACLLQGKPVLGICRGCQVMNVGFGGTLFQDLPSERPTQIVHSMPEPYNRKQHTVTVEVQSRLAGIIGAGEHPVNSMHHQAVQMTGKGLIVSAMSEDGFVEGIEYPDAAFCLGVQWHPERLPDAEESIRLAEAFVAACRK